MIICEQNGRVCIAFVYIMFNRSYKAMYLVSKIVSEYDQ